MKFKPKNFEKIIPPHKNGYRNGIVVCSTFDGKFILKNKYYKNMHHGCYEDSAYCGFRNQQNKSPILNSIDSGFSFKDKTYGEILRYDTFSYSIS